MTVSDAWVKAASSGTTAAFGTLTNGSAAVVDVVSAQTPASGAVELHEVVTSGGQSIMTPVEGGFKVPANGTLKLEPGGYHIMLMSVASPIKAGDMVPFTLTCAGGGTVQFTAQARTYSGADEKYEKEHDMSGAHSMSPSTAKP